MLLVLMVLFNFSVLWISSPRDGASAIFLSVDTHLSVNRRLHTTWHTDACRSILSNGTADDLPFEYTPNHTKESVYINTRLFQQVCGRAILF